MNQLNNQTERPVRKNNDNTHKSRWKSLPLRGLTVKDAVAGLTVAIPSIPDAMASGTLAGVNPIYGLYSLMIGTPVGAIFTGSVFMNVVTTGAMCITIAGGVSGYQGDELVKALVTIALVVGIVQVAAGLLRLGFLTRFISNSVMTGFITGIALLIILSQIGSLTGYESEYSNKVMRTFDTLVHFNQINVPTSFFGAFSILIIVILGRTPLRKYAMLVAVAIAIGLVMILKPPSVQLVGDISEIPSGFPSLYLPVPIFDIQLIFLGVAVAIIGLIQGSSISNAYPNPDGKYPEISRDFWGQGMANLAMSLFRGVPVGGSMSSTALIVSSGARSRWANIFTGLFAIIAVFFLKDLIIQLPMPTLAAILIVAGFQAINIDRIFTVWKTGKIQRIVMILTFLAVLALPIAFAVLVGIAIHVVLHIFYSASGVRILQLEPMSDGRYRETAAPEKLSSASVTIIMPVGDLFFAGAGYLQERLPSVENAKRTVVILRLRHWKEVGSTFLRVIEHYAQELSNNGGKLVLAGISSRIYQQMENTGLLRKLGEENVYSSTEIITESLHRAILDAREWISDQEIRSVSRQAQRGNL